MKLPVMKLGDKKETDSVFLKDKNNHIKLVIAYNLQELLDMVKKEVEWKLKTQ